MLRTVILERIPATKRLIEFRCLAIIGKLIVALPTIINTEHRTHEFQLFM
jgi:hypothetical protein